jgi:hypothetical protein
MYTTHKLADTSIDTHMYSQRNIIHWAFESTSASISITTSIVWELKSEHLLNNNLTYLSHEEVKNAFLMHIPYQV